MKLEDVEIGGLYWFEDNRIKEGSINDVPKYSKHKYGFLHASVVRVIRVDFSIMSEIESLDGEWKAFAYCYELSELE